MKLKTLVKKHAAKPSLFDYELFKKSTGLGMNDNVTLKDGIVAFDDAAESLFDCGVELSRKNPKNRAKKKSNTPWIIGGLALLGIGGAILYSRKDTSPSTSTEDKRTVLINWVATVSTRGENVTEVQAIFREMTPFEVDVMYNVVTNYFNKNITIPQGSKLRSDFEAISLKYNIFT